MYIHTYIRIYNTSDQQVVLLWILAVGLQEIAQDVVRCAKELDK